jgi:hypothetical protein
MPSMDLQPHLTGDVLELRPLRPDDWNGLFAVASDPSIWAGHPARDRYQQPVFSEYFREALESGGGLVAIDRTTRQVIGASRYFWYGLNHDELEIGWTFLARAYRGGVYNGEMKRLLLACTSRPARPCSRCSARTTAGCDPRPGCFRERHLQAVANPLDAMAVCAPDTAARSCLLPKREPATLGGG